MFEDSSITRRTVSFAAASVVTCMYTHNTLMQSGECRDVLEGHAGTILRLVVLPDGRLISGSEDTTLRLWSFEVQIWAFSWGFWEIVCA